VGLCVPSEIQALKWNDISFPNGIEPWPNIFNSSRKNAIADMLFADQFVDQFSKNHHMSGPVRPQKNQRVYRALTSRAPCWEMKNGRYRTRICDLHDVNVAL